MIEQFEYDYLGVPRCRDCGAPYGHYGHCKILNSAPLPTLTILDHLILHALGVCWDEPNQTSSKPQ